MFVSAVKWCVLCGAASVCGLASAMCAEWLMVAFNLEGWTPLLILHLAFSLLLWCEEAVWHAVVSKSFHAAVTFLWDCFVWWALTALSICRNSSCYVLVLVWAIPWAACVPNCRCWNYSTQTGSDSKYTDLCERCTPVMEQLGFIPGPKAAIAANWHQPVVYVLLTKHLNLTYTDVSLPALLY